VSPPPPSRLVGTHPEVWAVCFAPDGKTIASAADDAKIRGWEVPSAKPEGFADGRGQRFALAGHPSLVTALEYLPDGKGLVSGGYDGTVRFWDPATGTGRVLSPAHTAPVTGVAVSPDGRVAASRGRDGVVRVWDLAAKKHLSDLPGNRQMNGSVAFSPDGRVL